jgi:hypothetical protein
MILASKARNSSMPAARACWNTGTPSPVRYTPSSTRQAGRDSALLRHPPLRTVRDSFPSHGSSLYKGTLRYPVQQLRFSAL